MGRVVKVESRKLIITYTVKNDTKAIPKMKFLERSPRDVVILFSEKEFSLNSGEYFSNVLKDYKC